MSDAAHHGLHHHSQALRVTWHITYTTGDPVCMCLIHATHATWWSVQAVSLHKVLLYLLVQRYGVQQYVIFKAGQVMTQAFLAYLFTVAESAKQNHVKESIEQKWP